ncbi:MAG: hypothetical protein ACRC3H_12885 [Lachnospiraceae bacterium]
MKLNEFLKKCLLEYFMITTFISLAMAILGLLLDAEARFGYEAFFQPLIYGLICLVPGFLTYSSKELTKKQYVIRKVLSFIGIEALLYVIIVKGGAMSKVMDMLLFFVAVGIVYAAVHLFSWLVLQKTADQINMDLKKLQKKT